VDLPRAQGAALDIAELVEQEQRVIAGAAEMAVVRAAFLFAVGSAFARIHVEHDGSRPTAGMHLVDPLAWQISQSREVLGRPSHFVSKRPIWLADAADTAIARSPTTRRIAGLWHSWSASFTSS
jgi:hypothetical protein